MKPSEIQVAEVEVKDEILTAENVEIKLETLWIATSCHVHYLRKDMAQHRIVQAVIDGLSPEDRERFEEYKRRED